MSLHPAHGHTTTRRAASMFRRMLLMVVSLGVFAAVAAGGVSAKEIVKVTFTIDPIPPLTQTPLLLNCDVTLKGTLAYLDCHNAAPNPYPPKDEKTLKVQFGPNKFKATAYPDGEVVLTARIKAAFFS
jgi:hypothetical protein